MEIHVVQKILKANDEIGQTLRERFHAAGTTTINLMSAPGSGKTSLLEATIRSLGLELRIAVVEGDPDTTRDAERIAPLGVPVTQINTAGGCHLEAHLVQRAIAGFDLESLDLLFIENVGNLVCPAEFDLGETKRVALMSVPEGHDKPAKYSKLFRKVDLVVLNKVDLLPYVDFDLGQLRCDLAKLNPSLRLIQVSCRTGEGLPEWYQWLCDLVSGP
ncbi:MAG: hydrogenase nickel incorporation protein HypB [Candidatus Hydrogenedentes bacterium]|nr:hydrogenase nickel incorporation protein HypB [Candidatus Hydrogenedentota bacterium]